MASPLTPDDFRSFIPNPNGPQCDELKKSLLQFPQAFSQWYSYFYNDDGTVSDVAAQDICDALTRIGCASGGSSTTTGSTTGGTSTTTTIGSALAWAVTDQQKFLRIDLANGAVTVIKTGTSQFYGLAEDPTSGTLYGLVLNGSNIDLVTVDKVTGTETVVAASISLSTTPTGLTFDSSGVLYCELGATPSGCATNGSLKTINKSSGAVTAIGTQTSRYLGDICFKSSTLFAIGAQDCFSDLRLFSVNTSTGAVTTIAILDPSEGSPLASGISMAFINGILFFTLINEIHQINTGTGVHSLVHSYDSSTNGRIVGLAANQ